MLEQLAHAAHGEGRLAARGDGELERAALDPRREVEAAQFRVVGHVGPDSRRRSASSKTCRLTSRPSVAAKTRA